MPISPVELYDRLRSKLGEDESKALIDYVDGKVHGEVAAKEDLLLMKGEFQKDLQVLRDEIWKLRILVVIVLVLEIILNPKVIELVG